MVNKSLYEHFVDVISHEDKEQKIHEFIMQISGSASTHGDIINELYDLDVFLDLERKFNYTAEGSERKW